MVIYYTKLIKLSEWQANPGSYNINSSNMIKRIIAIPYVPSLVFLNSSTGSSSILRCRCGHLTWVCRVWINFVNAWLDERKRILHALFWELMCGRRCNNPSLTDPSVAFWCFAAVPLSLWGSGLGCCRHWLLVPEDIHGRGTFVALKDIAVSLTALMLR